LSQEVPGIETKQHDLAKFAQEQLGWTPEEIATYTNVAQRGMDAVNEISRINRAYDKWNAQNTVKTKKVTKQPAKVEEPGSGHTPAPEEDSFAKAKEAAKRGEISWTEDLLKMGSE
jgi:hypothetical protein